MTGPDDGQAATRPISVAELLARNGTIGAPPVGGRRRRRRGNNDSVTVAELTGEIPIVRTGEIPVVDEDGHDDLKDERPVRVEPEPERPAAVAPPPVNGNSRPAAPPAALNLDVPRTRPELAPVPMPRRETTPPRSNYPRPVRKGADSGPPKDRVRRARRGSVAGAELMSPDPIDDLDETSDAVLDTGTAAVDHDVQPDELGIADPSYLQSYLRATSGPLFGGHTVADDLARRGPAQNDLLVDDDIEVAEALEDDPHDHQDHDANVHEFDVDDEGQEDAATRGQLVLRGGWIALQSVLAVGFGAGLFIAFDQLWKWNNIVALVLSVLVILGLVVGVRVVRKTEDIASTLIAVAVGALVTLGPLALLQSN